MKTIKIIIISILITGFCNTTYAADSTNTDPGPGYTTSGDGYGLMALSGVTLTIGAVTTTPDQYYRNGVFMDKPFHKQGARASAIVCGVTLTVTGLIAAIANL
jgi:hypothetical protein